MSLTYVQIRTFKAQPDQSVKLFDGRGLYLEVAGVGRRWWRLKYRFAGKQNRLSLGVFPETSLKEARDRCDQARQLLMEGIDPSQQRQVEKLASVERAENTFEKIGREWAATTDGAIVDGAQALFQSTRPVWAATDEADKLVHPPVFQSTRPVWAATR